MAQGRAVGVSRPSSAGQSSARPPEPAFSMLMTEQKPSSFETFRDGLPEIGHPNPVVSLIPVVGSGLEAYADFKDGDYAEAALNAALAFTDLSLTSSVGRSLFKAAAVNTLKGSAAKKLPSMTWGAVSKRIGSRGLRSAEEDAHHALIPRNGWGKAVPDPIKNNMLNIKVLPKATHQRLHGSVDGLARFNPIERYIVGTPEWWKLANASSVGHAAADVKEQVFAPGGRPDRRR